MVQYVSGQCEVGTMESTGQARSMNSFYLNSNEPINCTGTIESVTYCYYRPSRTFRINRYSATFALYRLNSEGTNYTPVSSIFTVSRTQQQINNDFRRQNFACSTLTLPQPLSVEAGDVFGACVVNPSDRNIFRLDMVGRGTNTLRRMGRGCSDTAVPTSVSATGSTLTGTLYIHARVRPTTVTTSPVATKEEPTQSSRSELPTTNEVAATTIELVTTESNLTGVLGPGSSDSASATGTIAGAVVAVSLVLAATLVALVVIIFVLGKKKLKTSRTNPYAVSACRPQCSAIGKC